MSSGMWRCVGRVPDVSKYHTIFIFRVKQSKKTLRFLETSGTTHSTTQRHILEDFGLPQLPPVTIFREDYKLPRCMCVISSISQSFPLCQGQISSSAPFLERTVCATLNLSWRWLVISVLVVWRRVVRIALRHPEDSCLREIVFLYIFAQQAERLEILN